MAIDTAPVEAPDKEALIARNPHADFPAVEASRPDFDPSSVWTPSKTPKPQWDYGCGASFDFPRDAGKLQIDPQAPGRTGMTQF